MSIADETGLRPFVYTECELCENELLTVREKFSGMCTACRELEEPTWDPKELDFDAD